MTGPFYFAWSNPTDIVFGPSFFRNDESIFNFRMDHREGDFPLLTMKIVNPQVGLLSPGRKTWAWLSWVDLYGTVPAYLDIAGAIGAVGAIGTVYPIFFGQLVGVPDDLLGAIITLKFIARSLSFISDKQIVAETLKVAPYYDPIFMPLEKRDDPDSIAEGYSGSYHFDRVTLKASFSDWLIGEDGVEFFKQSDAFYDSLKVHVVQQPLTAVAVSATVSWSQQTTGTVDLGNNVFDSYSGDGFISGWPKPGQQLGGGWSCFSSYAQDVYNNLFALTATYQNKIVNQDTTHNTGDVLTVDISVSQPQLTAPTVLSTVTREIITPGIVDPGAIDLNGNPAPINRPMSVSVTSAFVPIWRVATSLVLRYDANRRRTEHLTFLLQSNLQPILTNPTISQFSELIEMTGADVGAPLFNLLNWSSIAGTPVQDGQIIFPDNPTLPGQTSTQICVQAGTTGLVEPNFSMIQGITTNDGGAIWVSLGNTPPPQNAPDWSQQTNTPLGQIIIPRKPFYVPYSALVEPGLAQQPRVGAQVSFGQVVQGTNGVFVQCTLGGITGLTTTGRFTEPNWPSTPGTLVGDGSVIWTVIGTYIPDGTTAYLATTAGQTQTVLPQFSPALGATTRDGTVVWTSLGVFSVPVGGNPGNVTARAYFPSDRGLTSVAYCIARARSRLRLRARAVTVSWDCRFERALAFSCRKNASVFDPTRLGVVGNLATGKIIAYSLYGEGKTAKVRGSVTIGCSVGFGEVVHEDFGSPSYAAPGYMQMGYQQMLNGVTLIDPAQADVGFTPPVYSNSDDGLTFPLSESQAVVFSTVYGDLASQKTGILSAFQTAKNVAIQEYTPQYNYGQPTNAWQSIQLQQLELQQAQNSVPFELSQNPISYEVQLEPVTNGPFDEEYNLVLTPLSIPQTINLEAT